MSEQNTVVIACAIVVAVGQVATAWISHRTHKAVNSRMSEFLENAEKKFMALGELKGAAAEKDRILNPPLQDMRGD
jgi:hypothetical protein